jgi:hypothetical protein
VPREECLGSGVGFNRAEVKNPPREAVTRDECAQRSVEAFNVFRRKYTCKACQEYVVVAVECEIEHRPAGVPASPPLYSLIGGYTTDRSGWTPGSSPRQAGAWPTEVWAGQCRGLTLPGLSIAGVAVVVLIVRRHDAAGHHLPSARNVTKLKQARVRGHRLPFQAGIWEGNAMARIEGSRPRSWQQALWLLMTAAGVLLLVCAALSL